MILSHFGEVLEKVPDYQEYLGIDELNQRMDRLREKHSDTVSSVELGKSSNGEVIKCTKVGNGKHNALVYGFPNPEEPVGGLVVDFLANSLAENRQLLGDLDFSWHFIPCIDPDGARLNAGFLKGPFTPLNFAKNYYRTPIHLTGEENFPFRVGEIDFNHALPETRALMALFSRTHFDLISSLHNMKWGGITYQVSEQCPQLYASLQELAREFRLVPRKRLGTMLAPGIQLAEYFTPVKNYVKAKAAGKGPLQPITGAFVFEYALLFNPSTFMMVPECCLWYDEKCWDDRPSGVNLAEVLKYSSQVDSETNKFLFHIYEEAKAHIKHSSPFHEMIRPIIQEIRSPTVNVLDPDPEFSKERLQRLATIGMKTETEGRADIYRLFNLGALIRLLDYEMSQSAQNKNALEKCRQKGISKLQEWANALDKRWEWKANSLRSLVGACAGSILYSADYVRWKSWHA